jgi:sugar lactone lactonase YvrE
MKTATSPGVRLKAGLSRALLMGAITTAIVAMTAGNLWAMPTVSWISGGPTAGYVNGNINDNVFYNTPSGLAVDQSGEFLLVADRNNNTVRLLDFGINNTATLLTYTNYVQTTNLFSHPIGVAIDDSYNIFVLNYAQGNNGTVLEFDDTSELIATNLANITNAAGMCIDPNDDIFVTASNHVIEVTAEGLVTNIATITASNAQLQGITFKHNGMLAVCDYGRDGILLINPANGNVTTNAGFHGQGDFVTATDTSISNTATFFHPMGIAASGDGTLIVSDFGNDRVKAVLANGSVTNVYGVQSNDWAGEQWPGFEDGTVKLPDNFSGVSARSPNGVVVAPDGSLYVSEDFYHILRHITGTGFTPLPPSVPAPPSSLTATVVTNAGVVEVNLIWNTSVSGNVTNYILSRATSSGGPYSIIDQTSGLTFVDSAVTAGQTYYYVVQGENAGGEGGNSLEASVTIPVPPPLPPEIGWVDFQGDEQDGFFTLLHPVSPGNPFIANNPINIAILPSVQGLTTKYVTVPFFTNNATAASVIANGSGAPVYEDGQLFGSRNVNYLPSLTLTNGLVTIEAVSINGVGENSSVTSASFKFEVGPVTINSPGGNAAQITLSDVTSNVFFYYTLDGTDPTNAPASQQIGTTNGLANLSLNGTTNILLEVRAIGFGVDAQYLMSDITPASFTTANFKPNTISWGFAQGEGSSAFIGAAGQTFFAPVTLTMVAGVPVYSLQFNMTVSSSGIGVTNPAPTAGPFGFQSMLMQPIPGTSPPLYTNIPPYMFASDLSGGFLPPISQTNLVLYNGTTNFVNLVISNGNELAVGWVERIGFTNLYNTLQQNLFTFSMAHDDLFPNAVEGEPNGVIAGAYFFKISPSAVNGQQYQVQLNRPSATDDGVGAPGSSVFIFAGDGTNSSALAPGSLNAIKNITVGTIPYLVGNVYPFGWFNAGDFGNSNLQSADVQQVFNSAIYNLNTPIYDPSSWNGTGYTNVSDMFDAMDSCGRLGSMDNNPGDEFFGYYTNGGPVTIAQQNALFSGDTSQINNMAFGDGKLDVSDVYLTFLRSEFTNNFLWFQRLWTNGVRVAVASPAPGVIPPGGLQQQVTHSGIISTPSITNTPTVSFVAGDYLATAGHVVSVPVNATVFGPYALRMLMLNISVVPLDGSPALTAPISFTPSPGLSTPLGSANPYMAASAGAGNISAVWLPNTASLTTQVPGFTGTANIGTLYITIPTNATSMSAYAIHFDHASASPSGLLSFPNSTFTGLITLSSRTSSYYGDGIPDSWRLRYFGTIYNQLSVSNADADGTGMSNWQKYQAGLNPMDNTSVLSEGLDQQAAQSPQDRVVCWPSVNNQTYIIMRSPTLFPAQWTAISTNIGDGTYMEIHDSSGGAQGYYEVTTP